MLSDKAKVLLRNTIDTTLEAESQGKHPLFTANYWADVMKNPKEYKKLVKEIERQASEKIN